MELAFLFLIFNLISTHATQPHYEDVIIRINNETCVYHQPDGTYQEKLGVGPINELAFNNPLLVKWKYYFDGKLRSTTNRCLEREKEALILRACTNDHEKSIWTVAKNGYLRFKKNCVSLDNGNFFLHDCDQIFPETAFKIEKFDMEALLGLTTKYRSQIISASTAYAFKQLNIFGSIVSEKINQLKQFQGLIALEDEGAENDLEDTKTLLSRLQANQRYIDRLQSVGSGVLVNIYEHNHEMPIASFISRQPVLSKSLLSVYGVDPGAQITIEATGLFRPPADGYYSFVLANLTTGVTLNLDGKNLITQTIPPLTGKVETEKIWISSSWIPISVKLINVYDDPYLQLGLESNDFSSSVIPSIFLSPVVPEAQCSSPPYIRISCSATFLGLPNDGEFHVMCPAGCRGENVSVTGDMKCFSVKSSICFSADSAGILPEKGGTITVQRTTPEGLFGRESALKGCGKVSIDSPVLGFYEVINTIKIVDKDDFLKHSSRPRFYSGYEGYIDEKYREVLLTRRTGDSRYIADLRLACSTSPTLLKLDNFEPVGGNEAEVYARYSRERNGVGVTEAYLASDGDADPLLSVNGFSRQTCSTSSGYVHLYLKYAKLPVALEYTSMIVSCSDTFSNILGQFEDFSTVTVRCPSSCASFLLPVSGFYLYHANSGVCRSAIHAGQITNKGGLVHITKVDNLRAPNVAIERNGIHSVERPLNSTEISFFVTQPRGYACAYPLPGYFERFGSSFQLASLLEITATVKQQSKTNASPTEVDDTRKSQDMVPLQNTMSNKQGSIRFLQEKTSQLRSRIFDGNSSVTKVQGWLEQTQKKQQARQLAIENLVSQWNSLQDALRNKAKELSKRIGVLNKIVENPQVLHSLYTQESFQDSHLNNRYLFVDAFHCKNGPGYWRLEIDELSKNNILTQEPAAFADKDLGTLAILKDSNLSKGFVYCVVRLPPGWSGTTGLVVKFTNQKNYIIFELNETGSVSFKKMSNGIFSEPCGTVMLPISFGTWIPIMVDFGERNFRAFIDGKVVTGCQFPEAMKTGSVGIFSNIRPGSTKLHFQSLSHGPLEAERNVLLMDYDNKRELPNRTSFDVPIELHHSPVRDLKQEPARHFPSSEIPFKQGTASQDKNTVSLSISNSWNIVPGSRWYRNADVEDFLTGEVLQPETPSIILTKNFNTDYIHSMFLATMRIIGVGIIGILLRANNPENFFAIGIERTNQQQGRLVALQISEGHTLGLPFYSMRPINEETWYTIKVLDDGKKLKCFLNEENVFNLSVDDTHPRGMMGLVVFEGKGDFKDVSFD